MDYHITTKLLKNGKKIKKEKIEKINNNEEEKLKLLNKVEYMDKEIIYRVLWKNKSNWK
jgi:hypothetical protein